MSVIQIGNYNVTNKRIGRGAFSTIYKGNDKYTNKIYAIKEINYDTNKKMMENIKNEFEIMKKLDHPNIIKLHEIYYDKSNKNIYLVLDYYQKGDLSKFLNGKSLKEPYARKYMKQLAEGLEYLKDHNIMHRDLKPQNILVSDDYILKITDFGFARYIDSNMIIQTLCGSPMYMAPEIMKYKKYNDKSDLWSVGVIMYEILAGKVPFKAKNFIDLIKCVNKKKITFPINIEISDSCRELLFGLIEKKPEDRIEWDDFFNSAWFSLNTSENKLLEFSISDGSSLPTLNKLRPRANSYNQFHSFKHKSIRDISAELESEQDLFGDKQIVVSLNSSNDDSTDDSSSDESEYYESIDDSNHDKSNHDKSNHDNSNHDKSNHDKSNHDKSNHDK